MMWKGKRRTAKRTMMNLTVEELKRRAWMRRSDHTVCAVLFGLTGRFSLWTEVNTSRLFVWLASYLRT